MELNSINNNNYQCNPFINNEKPGQYGGSQTDYNQRVKNIILSTAEIFKKAVEEKADLEAVFHLTCNTLASERSNIARTNKTPAAEDFGKPRSNISSITSITSLTAPYDKYNEKLFEKITPQLEKLDMYNIKEGEHNLLSYTETALNATCHTDYAIYEATHSSLSFKPRYKVYKKIHEKYNTDPLNELCSRKNFTLNHFNALIKNEAVRKKLKESDPFLYDKIKLDLVTSQIEKKFCYLYVDGWMRIKYFLEINGIKYELSQYIARAFPGCIMTPSDTIKAIEAMKEGLSTLTIVHQDTLLIDPILKEIAKVFKEAIQWDGKDIQELKNRVILLEYLFAHAMPYLRGSSAIEEWLIAAIYHFHGYQISYNPDMMPNLEALTSTLGEFTKNYDSIVKVEKNS